MIAATDECGASHCHQIWTLAGTDGASDQVVAARMAAFRGGLCQPLGPWQIATQCESLEVAAGRPVLSVDVAGAPID